MKLSRLSLASAMAVVLALPAFADCGIASGSVRILSNDFAALRIVNDAAMTCATDKVTVTANATTEHKNLQVAALTANPAEYTVAVVANNSIVPLMNEDLIRPLDDLVAKYGQELQPNQLIKIDGKIMAIAFMANSQHLFLRKDILEANGIPLPKTWEEVLSAAQVLRDKGVSENPIMAANGPGWELAAEFVNMYLGTGADFFAPGSAELAIDNDQGRAVLKMMKDLAAYMSPDHVTMDADTMGKTWSQGGLVMMQNWGSAAGGILDPANATPEVVAGTVVTAAPTVGGGSIPAAAVWWDGFTIAKNISDEDAEASFQAMVKGISPETVAANPTAATWLVAGYTPTPVAEGVIGTAMGGGKPYPMVPYMGTLHEVLGTELVDYMKGAEDADKAIADITAAYSAAAKSAGFLQ
jgi:multiple sugar transport system substrate-binding protein